MRGRASTPTPKVLASAAVGRVRGDKVTGHRDFVAPRCRLELRTRPGAVENGERRGRSAVRVGSCVAQRRAHGKQAHVVGRLGGEPRQDLVAELLDRVAGEFCADIAELGKSVI